MIAITFRKVLESLSVFVHNTCWRYRIMEKTVRFDDNLDMFENIVLLYKDENGDTYLGSASYNGNEPETRRNRIVLYKNHLPKDQDYLTGWNYLDDNSDKIYLVYNEHSDVGVDDFLAAHSIAKTWKDIEYRIVDGMCGIAEALSGCRMADNEVLAFAVMK